MALTSVPTNARVIRFQNKFYREFIRGNRFSKVIGTDENSPIQLNEDLKKQRGEQTTFYLANRLTGTGRYNRFECDPDILNSRETRFPGFANESARAPGPWRLRIKSHLLVRVTATPGWLSRRSNALRGAIDRRIDAARGIRDGIPVMLVSEARKVGAEELGR